MSQLNVSLVNRSLDITLKTVTLSIAGGRGPRGRSVLNGDAEPSPTAGLVGDFFIDTSAMFIYGPKTSEGWGDGTSMCGVLVDRVTGVKRRPFFADGVLDWEVVE